MALIPPDAGVLLRMQSEARLQQPIQPVHDISPEFNELRPGQIFNARIQETLPDNTFKALVAGKQLTLQLPEGAKSGDTLELIVLDRSPKVLIARRLDAHISPDELSNRGAYPFTKLTAAARMISQLLPAEGKSAPPAQLNQGQPLLALTPPAQNAAALLAPKLASAVANSGLFYESHQMQWINGKRTLEQLRQEPQARRSVGEALRQAAAQILSQTGARGAAADTSEQAQLNTAAQAGKGSNSGQAGNTAGPQAGNTPVKAGANPSANPAANSAGNAAAASDTALPKAAGPLPGMPQPQTTTPQSPQQQAGTGQQQGGNPQAGGGQSQTTTSGQPPPSPAATPAAANRAAAAGNPQGGNQAPGQVTTQSTPQQQTAPLPQVPDELRPIVQQQLEAVATQRMVWHGEVWPRQFMEMQIERDWEREGDGSEEDERRWRTSLSLTTPRLGRVDAHLRLTVDGVRISLSTADGNSAEDLREAGPKLVAAMNNAGVPLIALQVRQIDSDDDKSGEPA